MCVLHVYQINFLQDYLSCISLDYCKKILGIKWEIRNIQKSKLNGKIEEIRVLKKKKERSKCEKNKQKCVIEEMEIKNLKEMKLEMCMSRISKKKGKEKS